MMDVQRYHASIHFIIIYMNFFFYSIIVLLFAYHFHFLRSTNPCVIFMLLVTSGSYFSKFVLTIGSMVISYSKHEYGLTKLSPTQISLIPKIYIVSYGQIHLTLLGSFVPPASLGHLTLKA